MSCRALAREPAFAPRIHQVYQVHLVRLFLLLSLAAGKVVASLRFEQRTLLCADQAQALQMRARFCSNRYRAQHIVPCTGTSIICLSIPTVDADDSVVAAD